MRVIFVRHAAAIERSGDMDDEMRYLTPEGRVFFRKTAKTMRDQGIDPGLILTSPLLRAVQTADILAETIRYEGALVVTDELAPGFDPAALERLINSQGPVKELVLVGHEPDFGEVVTSLLTLRSAFSFKKGSAMRLDLPSSGLATARFKWLALGKKLSGSLDDLQ